MFLVVDRDTQTAGLINTIYFQCLWVWLLHPSVAARGTRGTWSGAGWDSDREEVRPESGSPENRKRHQTQICVTFFPPDAGTVSSLERKSKEALQLEVRTCKRSFWRTGEPENRRTCSVFSPSELQSSQRVWSVPQEAAPAYGSSSTETHTSLHREELRGRRSILHRRSIDRPIQEDERIIITSSTF